jgi:hypothetical protein
MNRLISSLCTFGVAFGCCLTAKPARAYDFEVSSSTQAYVYQLRRYDQNGLSFTNRRRITQLLGLRVFNLLDDGRLANKPASDKPPRLLQIKFLMRFFTDYGDFARSSLAPPELRDDRFELLFGSLEGRNFFGFVDFSLGRQYDLESLDIFAYDGLRVRLNIPYGLFVESYFGVQVNRSHPLSIAVFQTDGTSDSSDADDVPAPALGVALGVSRDRFGVRLAYRGVASYARAVDDAGPSWGIDQEILVASGRVTLPWLESRIASGVRYNLLNARIDELYGRILQPIGRHRVELEALHSRPHFDGDSIFNVFALEPFNELAGRFNLRLGSQFSVEARAGHRWMWSDALENSSARALTLMAALGWRHLRSFARLEGFYLRSEHAGRRYGGELYGRWLSPAWFWGQRIGFSGRLSLARYEQIRQQSTGASSDQVSYERGITNLGLQAGAEVRFLPNVRLFLSFEDNISRLYDSALRFLALLDMEFQP